MWGFVVCAMDFQKVIYTILRVLVPRYLAHLIYYNLKPV